MNKQGNAEFLVFAAFSAIALIGLLLVLESGATGAAVRTVKDTTASGSLKMTPPLITVGGIPATTVPAGSIASIGSTLTNPQSTSQTFSFVVDVRDSKGTTVKLSWISGTLAPGETRPVSVLLVPELVGVYQVNVQLPATPPSIAIGKSLAAGASVPVTVTTATR